LLLAKPVGPSQAVQVLSLRIRDCRLTPWPARVNPSEIATGENRRMDQLRQMTAWFDGQPRPFRLAVIAAAVIVAVVVSIIWVMFSRPWHGFGPEDVEVQWEET
jgi:hypothetical protein